MLGLARSGIPAAKFLAARGAVVCGYDNKSHDQLSIEACELEQLGIQLFTGENAFSNLRGASMVVLSPGLKIHHSPLKEVLENARKQGAEIIGEMELAARFCPASIIAVTGTKGKSTTVKLITELLQACGQHAIACGNTGLPLMAALPHLTPSSWAVLEVSSFQLEMTQQLRPDIAVLLNLLEDHQDYHPSLNQYWQTKMRLFAHQTKADCAVLNHDERRVLEYTKNLSEEVKVLFTSAHDCQECSVEVEDGHLGWRHENQFIPILHIDHIPLAGKHNQANVAAALGVLLAALGEKVLLQADNVARIIHNFSALPHRLEVVCHAEGITWVNDSQATIPDASAAALEAFPAPLILIAGGRAKLEPASYDRWATLVAERAAALITIGEAGQMLEDAASQAGMAAERIYAAGDLESAIHQAKQWAASETTVVLSPACASFDQFKSYEERGKVFGQLVRQENASGGG